MSCNGMSLVLLLTSFLRGEVTGIERQWDWDWNHPIHKLIHLARMMKSCVCVKQNLHIMRRHNETDRSDYRVATLGSVVQVLQTDKVEMQRVDLSGRNLWATSYGTYGGRI